MNSDSVANMYGVFPKEQYTTFHKTLLMWLKKNDTYVCFDIVGKKNFNALLFNSGW